VAAELFHHRQNYRTISIEICNNDILPGDQDWDAAADRAAEWAAWFLNSRGLHVDLHASLNPQRIPPEDGKLLLLRHYDLTGKICPKPFVDDPVAWIDFVEDVYGRLS